VTWSDCRAVIVAMDAGFRDLSNFNHVFRAGVRCQPDSLQKEVQRKRRLVLTAK